MKNTFLVTFIATLALSGGIWAQAPGSATDLALDVYRSCLKDFDVSCIKPKALQWYNEVLPLDEIRITDKLALIRTGKLKPNAKKRALTSEEQMFDDIDNFLGTHALHVRAPEFFKSKEGRSFVPDFLLDNALVKDAVVPLGTPNAVEGRGFVRKVMLPFLLGLKFKTMVVVPLALALIALKTWKAMTLGLLSLVLSGALVIFKIAKPKIVNYEVVHYPHHDHIEHIPHHVEHIVPHHVEHIVPHHVDHIVPHHLDLPHVEHIEHAAPTWDPHAWSRSSQEPQNAQDMAYNAQRRR